ncbi:hypothetical protein Cfor_09624, partial [Coptotermes formosanus]
WKGSLQSHLWHRGDGLSGYIRPAESHGCVGCHSGHCGVCFGLLPAANGRPVGYQCCLDSSGPAGICADWCGYCLVQPVRFQALRHRSVYGAPAAAGGLSLRSALRGLRSYNNFLDPLYYY